MKTFIKVSHPCCSESFIYRLCSKVIFWDAPQNSFHVNLIYEFVHACTAFVQSTQRRVSRSGQGKILFLCLSTFGLFRHFLNSFFSDPKSIWQRLWWKHDCWVSCSACKCEEILIPIRQIPRCCDQNSSIFQGIVSICTRALQLAWSHLCKHVQKNWNERIFQLSCH